MDSILILVAPLIGIICWDFVLREDPYHSKLLAFLMLIICMGCFIILLTRSTIKLNLQTISLIVIIGCDLIKDGVKILLRQIRFDRYKIKNNYSSEYLNGYKDAIDDMNKKGI